MFEQYIIYGIWIYFLGLVISSILPLISKSFEKSAWLFVFVSIVGSAAGILYLFGFSGDKILITGFGSFKQFNAQITPLSGIFFVVTSGISALVGIYSVRYLSLYQKTYNPRLVQALMSLFVLGMQGVLLASSTLAFLFFWEVMSVTSFFLVLSDKTKESIKAAFLYFIMTHLGASAILGGFLILGKGSILFDLNDIRSASQALSPAFSSLAFLLFIFGFGSKAGLVPFHVWLPEAHPQAPSNISALMSGLMLKIAVYGFILVVVQFFAIPSWAGIAVLFLGLLSGLVGVLNAVTKRDIKTAFAYSSIENIGIIFTMLGLAIYFLTHGNSAIAFIFLAFAIVHIVSHALFKTALFLSSGVIISRLHGKSLDRMGGVAKMMPLFAGAFLLAILSSLPLPPFGTFYGEWGLIRNIILMMHQGVADTRLLALLLLVLTLVGLISGLAIFAMIKIFSISMLGLPHNEDMDRRPEGTDRLMILPIFILGAGVLLTGVFASRFIPALASHLESFSRGGAAGAVGAIDISSLSVGAFLIALAILVYSANKIFFRNKNERSYGTWDCGQPIDATMQYSATAFAAPIRFFFTPFVGREILIKSEPILGTNPWIRKYTFKLYIKAVWTHTFYDPIARGTLFVAEKIRFIQNGRIQYYVLFVLLALIITLIFAL